MISNLLAFRGYPKESKVQLKLRYTCLLTIDTDVLYGYKPGDTYSILHTDTPYIHRRSRRSDQIQSGISAVYFRQQQQSVLVKPGCTCMITEQNSNTSIPPLQYAPYSADIYISLSLSLYSVDIPPYTTTRTAHQARSPVSAYSLRDTPTS